MAQPKKPKINAEKPRAAASVRELEASIGRNVSPEELEALKESLVGLIALAENRIAELKRLRIEAIEAEIAMLKQERDSLK